MFEKIIHFFNRQKIEDHDDVYSVDEFRNLIERERARVERNEHIFSMIIFNVRRRNGTIEKNTLKIIKTRLRTSDFIGWFNNLSLGILLPDTTTKGARKLAESVQQKVTEQKIQAPNFIIYSYPDDWFTQQNDNSDSESGNGNGRDKTQKVQFERQIKKIDDVTKQKPFSLKRSGANRIESLFVEPLPLGKRIFDIIFASSMLILLSPLFLVIAGLIKLVSRGPVFYKQERLGYLGTSFTFWKFRTMKVNASSNIHQEYMKSLIKAENSTDPQKPMRKLDMDEDNRIIPFGKILRYSCLDELPQLFNVLCRDMSIVGPRPCLPYEAENYQLWHTRRFDVMPGMTGMWQVKGKNKTTFREMIRMDIQYCQKSSFGLDIIIGFKTINAVLEQIKEGLLYRNKTNS